MQITAPIPSHLRAPRSIGGLGRTATAGVVLLVAAVFIGVGLFAYQRLFAPAPTAPVGQIVTVQRGTIASTVSATGSTVATKQAKLVFQSAGRLAEIPVNLGDRVTAGQALARLDTAPLELKLDTARSQLAVAQVKLQQLTESATPEDVTAAEASYDAAMAKLQDLQAGATAADLQAAQAAVVQAQSAYDAAEAKLKTMQLPPLDADQASAQAALTQAQNTLDAAVAKLSDLQAGATTADLVAAQSAVDQARSGLASAQTKLQQVQASAAQANADVAAAQAAFDTAKSKLDQVKATNAIPVDVQAAVAGVVKAQADLDAAKRAVQLLPDQLKAASDDLDAKNHAIDVDKAAADSLCSQFGDSSTQCRSAQSQVDRDYVARDQAQTTFNGLNGGNAPDVVAANQGVTTAQANLDSANVKLQQARAAASVPADLVAAQASYDSAKAKLDQVRVTAAIPADVAAAQSAVDQAKSTVASAQAKLDQVKAGATTADLVAAQTAVDTAQANLASAQAKLDGLGVNTPQDLQAQQSAVASARSGVQSAQAKLAQLQAGPTQGDLAAAQSSVAQAQADLATKSGNAKPSDIALAQESVRQAELAVKQAQLDLDNATLTAPFDGIVAAVSGNVGEQAPTGTTGFMTLIDPSQTRVDVTVDETDVAKVQVGKAAAITFDALPNQNFVGKVIAVSPSGTLSQGVVTYPVSLSIERARFGPNGNVAGTSLAQSANGAAQRFAAAGQSGQVGGQTAGRAQAQARPSSSVQPGGAGAASPSPSAPRQAGQRQPGQVAQAQQEQVPIILPAGLTASVTITIEQKDDALTVPNRAIRRSGRDQVVDVQTDDGKTEQRVVQTGLTNDQSTEIMDGLAEGDQVVIPTTTTRQPAVNAGPGNVFGGPVVRPPGR